PRRSVRWLVRGELLVVLAAVLWALIGPVSSELVDAGVPAERIGAWRALLGGACFVVHSLLARRRHRPSVTPPGGGPQRPERPPSGASGLGRLRTHSAQLGAFCVVGVVLFYSSLPLAVEAGGISLAWVLMYTAPIWVAIGAALFLGEPIGGRGLLAVGMSVAGVVALVSSVGGTVTVSAESLGWGLAAGVSYSSYYLVGRRLFESLGAVRTYAVVLPVGGLFLALTVGLDVPGAGTLAWLLVLGVGCTYLPYLAFGFGIQFVPSNRAVVLATVEPLVAMLLGVLLYGESLGRVGVVGGVVVVAAAVLAGLPRSDPAPAGPPSPHPPPN
ncbi:MAG: EamA family transporter, partial [Microthrixaceae bacterium]|nr:EamA family transporter [Microthrixaceae bacterium]